MNHLLFLSAEEWRAWLEKNHGSFEEVWLVYFKKTTGKPCISYQDSLDEALCYGWVDSLIKKIDEKRFARKFTPRRDGSKWSKVNKKRVQALIKAGRMTEFGMRKVAAAKASGNWDNPVSKPKLDLTIPEEFAHALHNDQKARDFYNQLSLTYQKQYLIWIITAKRTETKNKRIAESIRLLHEGKKLGLK